MSLSSLSPQDFEALFDQIIELKISEEEIKKILLALNEENLPTNAFIGAVTALRKRMKKVSAPENAIDVCGTGGDGLNTLNISTAVCFVVAAAGVPVAKHGNKAISSRSGSADIFAELGIKISSDIGDIERNLREKNLCFLFAPFFHEALRNVAAIRKSLGVPTIFNFLGPLLNPANTRFQLIGTSRHDVMEKMYSALQLPTTNYQLSTYIIHGFDGMDEITLTDKSYLLHDGAFEIIDPTRFGFKLVAPEALHGADPKHNAQKLVALLEGEKSAYRDIVVLNSAFALQLAKRVSSVGGGIDLANEMIDSGAAKVVLEKHRA
ncbi:MAG: anthranilate phosphoribosyltransferase [Alphaproteobacteria bacterium]|nr:anthranilate phosphoribosyltransferase [Alphaproteobacteria bacterium]